MWISLGRCRRRGIGRGSAGTTSHENEEDEPNQRGVRRRLRDHGGNVSPGEDGRKRCGRFSPDG